MPRHEIRTRRRSPEHDEEEHMLFLHEIPPSARWQELKDLAKEYGTVHYRSADTIKPYHETGYIFIAGRQNAEHAFNQFCQRGWRGQSIVVTLNGPVDRARIQSGGHDPLKIVAGPVRSPGFDARASQRRQQPDWNVLHAAAIANYVQQRTPPIIPISGVTQRSPTTSTNVVAPVTTAPAYRPQATYVGLTMNARYAPAPAHMPGVMHRPEVPTSGTRHDSRHVAAVQTFQSSIVARDHYTALTHFDDSKIPAAPQPLWRSVRVQNLDPEFERANIKKLFERFGTLEACRIQQVRDSRGRVRSLTAFATYSEAVHAARALVSLNGRQVCERKLSVTFDGRADRNREQLPPGRPALVSSHGRNPSRHRSGTHEEEDHQAPRDRGQSTRGPLVVNGAPGSGRRRRDSDIRDRARSSDDESDSDTSDEERESRRRGSNGRCSVEHRVEDMTRLARSVRV